MSEQDHTILDLKAPVYNQAQGWHCENDSYKFCGNILNTDEHKSINYYKV